VLYGFQCSVQKLPTEATTYVSAIYLR